jgi:hypothetical protein
MTLRGMVFRSSVLFLASVLASAECTNPVLKDQKKDPETIQKLEKAWSAAFSQGDTAFETCLLTPDFVEIRSNGKINLLNDELALAAKHKGNAIPAPDPLVPPSTVHIHGDVAVAYGLSPERMIDGKPYKSYFADYYVWKDGQWRVYFAQQTLFASI